MQKHIDRFRAGLAACLLTSLALAGSAAASEISAEDKQFLADYENVRAALAADDLAAAKAAAMAMGEAGTQVAQSADLAVARKQFAPLSARALKLTAGTTGYFHVRCPMLKQSWVQTSATISNPYAGKSMLTCGVIKPQKEEGKTDEKND